MKIGIFTSFQSPKVTKQAAQACEELGIDHQIVDITCANWLQNVKEATDCDGFFCPSSCISQEIKSIQDERYFFVSQVLKRPIYPNFLGLYTHESKRNMAAFLELYDYPHAKTRVFTSNKEAIEYLNQCSYPIIIKANVGAAASKVRIVRSKRQAICMAKQCLPTRFKSLRAGLEYSVKIWGLPFPDRHNPQKDYFLVQEFVPNILHEWRILKIGDSYFGHQKLLKGDFASGSGLVGWVKPPFELLDLVRDICEKGNFPCMDVDVFETAEGKFYVNELQASFGSYLDYQMMIDGKHGRFVYKNGKYTFEEGDFNVLGSTKLKIEHFAQLLKQKS